MDYRQMFEELMGWLRGCLEVTLGNTGAAICDKLDAILEAILGINPNDFELKTIPSGEFCCPDGKKYCSLICQKFKGIEKIGEETIYVDKQTGRIIDALPDCAEPCGELEAECNPKQVSFKAKEGAPEGFEFNEYSFYLPPCCCLLYTSPSPRDS